MKETPEVNNAHWLAENDFAIDIHKEMAKDILYKLFFEDNNSQAIWDNLYKTFEDTEDQISFNLLEERKRYIDALVLDRSKRLDYLF